MNRWRKLIPYLTFLFIALITYLLYQNLSSINWSEVKRALKEVSMTVTFTGLIISACIYFLLSSYDILTFKFLHIKAPTIGILGRAFVSYAFNLNLGSLVGGLAVRYRLYSKWKIEKEKIPFIIGISTFTNWLGYTFLLSLIALISAEQISKLIGLSSVIIQGAGVLALCLIAWYFYACFRGKSLSIRGKVWDLPSPSMALLQLALSTLQWSLQSVIIFTILKHLGIQVSYFQILFTFMVSSIIAVFTHIPAGLGVLEVVFLRMKLGIPHSELLVALITYRVVYYVFPLIIALPFYMNFEWKDKKLVGINSAH